MISRRLGLFAIALSFSAASCSSMKTTKHSHKKTPAPSTPTNIANATSTETPVDPNAPAVEDDEDEVDSNTEHVEGSGTEGSEVADVEASDKLLAAEIQADIQSRKTFPLVYNEFVAGWIRYFTGRGRGFFTKWLERSTRYIPAMKQVMREQGLPEDLIYLSMIESGFNPKAASHAKAVGPWQFIKSTGQRYNLEVDYWIDERRDYRKSTYAAATYLKELHTIFGSWYLAAAAYNAGEGKVLSAVRRDKSRNFWELSRTKQNFRAETRNYVPKIIAAALISKHPEQYGFLDLDYEKPLAWEPVNVPGGVDLRAVAELVNTDLEDLQILNSELRRGITPAHSESFTLKIPGDKKDLLLAKLDEIKVKRYANMIEHTVRRGESLGSIARRYGSSSQSIMELNHISSAKKLKVGMEISIPVGDSKQVLLGKKSKKSKASPVAAAAATPTSPAPTAPASPAAPAAAPAVASNASYKVKSGDNLWKIAKQLKVKHEDLLKANGLDDESMIKPGQVLKLPQ